MLAREGVMSRHDVTALVWGIAMGLAVGGAVFTLIFTAIVLVSEW